MDKPNKRMMKPGTYKRSNERYNKPSDDYALKYEDYNYKEESTSEELSA